MKKMIFKILSYILLYGLLIWVMLIFLLVNSIGEAFIKLGNWYKNTIKEIKEEYK